MQSVENPRFGQHAVISHIEAMKSWTTSGVLTVEVCVRHDHEVVHPHRELLLKHCTKLYLSSTSPTPHPPSGICKA